MKIFENKESYQVQKNDKGRLSENTCMYNSLTISNEDICYKIHLISILDL